MPITVTVEDGSGIAGANSYASVASADAYFASRPRSTAWTSLVGDDAKAPFMIHATRLLDSAVTWSGEKVADDQALQFPRYIDGENVGVPPVIMTALYELAIALIGKDLTAEPGSASGFSAIKVGPIELETAAGTAPPAAIPRFVRDLIAPYGTARAGTCNARLFRT